MKDRLKAALLWGMRTPTRAAVSVALVLMLAATALVFADWARRVADYREAVAAVSAPAEATPTATPRPLPTMAPMPSFPTYGGVAQGEDPDEHDHAPATVDPTDPATAEVQQAAEGFARAWLAGAASRDTSTWSASVAPLVVPDLAIALPLTDPTRIPTSPLTEVAVQSVAPEGAVALAELENGQRLRISLAVQPEGWLVTDYDLA